MAHSPSPKVVRQERVDPKEVASLTSVFVEEARGLEMEIALGRSLYTPNFHRPRGLDRVLGRIGEAMVSVGCLINDVAGSP